MRVGAQKMSMRASSIGALIYCGRCGLPEHAGTCGGKEPIKKKRKDIDKKVLEETLKRLGVS